MEVDERSITILVAYLHLAKEAGVKFENSTLENLTIGNLFVKLGESGLVNEKYFERLVE